MIIREAAKEDLPGILRVLKESLGENSSKKTEAVWNYKHVLNPFGSSLVLLAEEDNEIVGVRAFMRWKWQNEQKSFSAFRAVDTATHPKHQGKGIFKALTQKALELGIKGNNDFVFNTPNEQSRPGYLKMGWRKISKIEIDIYFGNPLYFFDSVLENTSQINYTQEKFDDFLDIYNKNQKKKFISTYKTIDYLIWRYENNPMQKYCVIAEDNYYLAVYLKIRGNLKELRISEQLFIDESGKKASNRKVRELGREFGAHIITVAPSDNKIKLLKFNGKFGPFLTIKKLGIDSSDFNELKRLSSWDYSLGDLELF